MSTLVHLPEPSLLFNYRQAVTDPRDGLTLFGPLDKGKPYGIRAGVVGTSDGIRKFRKWVGRIQLPISNEPQSVARPLFPGFEAAFRIPWGVEPALAIEVDDQDLHQSAFIDDVHQRVFKTVDVFAEKIASAAEEDLSVDLWFLVVPDYVYENCRPRSNVPRQFQVKSTYKMSRRYARERRIYAELLPGDDAMAEPYHYSPDFRHQLKARLLAARTLTQVIRESTIAPQDYVDLRGRPKRDLAVLESDIAWHLSTAAFYKAGGRPWRIASIRDGVCYLGLAFKVDDRGIKEGTAACGAQMFLDSGDGIVFRGALGPWYNPQRGDFHLARGAARELVRTALDSYYEKHGIDPKELFIHGTVRFDDDEWAGFSEGVPRDTQLVGVRIREVDDLRLFRSGEFPVLRGLAYIRDDRTAYLWTKGYTPRLQTYPGREVPKPLLVDVCRGNVSIDVVLRDIMALTKLNYNACRFSSGPPITLRFARGVGEVLTAGPIEGIPPLPFKHYI